MIIQDVVDDLAEPCSPPGRFTHRCYDGINPEVEAGPVASRPNPFVT
ncbi:MAG: hypothetical protein IH621_12195 [Krumholzibacteria bacterium]|nr:hypothetical protein [Candidatus Krumholzibacteria bacterium]